MSYLDHINDDIFIKISEYLSIEDINSLHNVVSNSTFSKYYVNKLRNPQKTRLYVHVNIFYPLSSNYKNDKRIRLMRENRIVYLGKTIEKSKYSDIMKILDHFGGNYKYEHTKISSGDIYQCVNKTCSNDYNCKEHNNLEYVNLRPSDAIKKNITTKSDYRSACPLFEIDDETEIFEIVDKCRKFRWCNIYDIEDLKIYKIDENIKVIYLEMDAEHG